jgi:hypothetical protein
MKAGAMIGVKLAEKHIHIDVGEKQVKELTIGDHVLVKIKGKVDSLSAGDRNPGPDRNFDMAPRLGLVMESVEVIGPNQFEQMSEEDD